MKTRKLEIDAAAARIRNHVPMQDGSAIRIAVFSTSRTLVFIQAADKMPRKKGPLRPVKTSQRLSPSSGTSNKMTKDEITFSTDRDATKGRLLL